MRCGIRRLIALLGAALLWVGPGPGCSGLPAISEQGQLLEAQAGEGMVKMRQSPVPDVPMPVGFRVVTERSRAYAIDGARYVEHRYQGRGALGDLVSFYRRHLPDYGWRVIVEQAEPSGDVRLQYRKGRETLDLLLVPTGGRVGRVLTIMLRIQDPQVGDPYADQFHYQ